MDAPTSEIGAYVLIAIGFLMVFAELFVPSFGLLGIGGLALFTYGASLIFSGDAMLIVWAIDGAALLIMAIVGAVFLRARKVQTQSGVEGMIGKTAEIIEWGTTEGRVSIQGELWQARNTHGTVFRPGDKAIVSGHDDLILTIRKD